jgi:hypothetical protein
MVSNNLALAEMVQPVWAGSLHVHDAASRRWFKKSQTALLAWSSQARGFFVPGRAHPDRRDDASLVASCVAPSRLPCQPWSSSWPSVRRGSV